MINGKSDELIRKLFKLDNELIWSSLYISEVRGVIDISDYSYLSQMIR